MDNTSNNDIYYFDIETWYAEEEAGLEDNGPFNDNQEGRNRIRELYLETCGKNQKAKDQVNNNIDWTATEGFWSHLAKLRIVDDEGDLLYDPVVTHEENNKIIADMLRKATDETTTDLYVVKYIDPPKLKQSEKHTEGMEMYGLVDERELFEKFTRIVNSGGEYFWCGDRRGTFTSRKDAENHARRLAFTGGWEDYYESIVLQAGVMAFILCSGDAYVKNMVTVTKIQVKGKERKECYDLT